MRGKLFLLVIEALVVATVFHLDYLGLLPFSKTPFLFLLGWISIRLRGQRWKDVGLQFDQPLLKLLVFGIVVGIAMEALELFVTQPLLTKILGQGPDLHELQRLIGNTQLLILGIVLAWLLAAFGEELVYRGYLTNRLAELFGASKAGWIAAAVLITLLFGLAHFPQGPTGIIENVIDGAILAAIYFATGRNLWAPIIAHGIQDTVDVLLIYLGKYPGLNNQSGVAMF
ncbi:MAG TPA: type II CAAX endopeptidase family protein [Chthoniobacterales bacterium]|nr:type II CAAX endopeptidase family protein [Chthoniobacterales bacterium]